MKFALLLTLLFPLESALSQVPAPKPDLLRRGTDTMAVFFVNGGDTTATGFVFDELATVVRNGRTVLRRVYRSDDATLGARVDTIFDDAATLKPIAIRSRTSAMREHIDFRNDRAIGWMILANGDSLAVDVAVPPDAYNGSSLDLFLRSSLFDPRWRALVPSFVSLTRTVVPVGAIFRGTDEIDGVATWRVWAEVMSMPVTFWIDQQTRRLVRQVMEIRPGVEILFTRPRPTAAPRRSAS